MNLEKEFVPYTEALELKQPELFYKKIKELEQKLSEL